jgi:multidrug efflux pump subunit AcrA (membrane-fusion protein)
VFVAEGKGEKPADLSQKLQAAATAMAPVLIAQLRAEQPVFSRALEWGGRSLAALRGHPLRAALLVLAVAAVYFLAFAKAEYRVAADSKLEGVFRRSIVAPFDGYIVDAKARPGDKVAAGAELGRLDDRDLRMQRVDLEAKILEVSRQIDEAMGKREIAKVNILDARKDQHQADLKVVTENLARTVMTAPFAAYVVSGDKTQSIGSPVRRGDVLYEVAPLESFRVDLEIPQADFAAIQIGQTGRMLLTSMPYKTFAITIVRVTPIAAARDGKTVFRAEAELEESDPLLRPGMQGVARIEVGERHLLWIWTHTVVDWLRVKLWEWLP